MAVWRKTDALTFEFVPYFKVRSCHSFLIFYLLLVNDFRRSEAMLKQLLLGNRTGLRVSELVLGTGRLGTSASGESDAATARLALEAFADAGGTFIDTSSAYQLGEAEAFTGAFLKDSGRDSFVIGSKYGRTTLPTPSAGAVGSHRRVMRSEVEGSLRRLGTDRIDLYFPHFDDGATPIEEIMHGLDDLVRAGKIIHVGLSNFPAWRAASAAIMAELRGWAPVVALQLEYSLLERNADREHLPLAAAHGLGVMAYSPLAGGQITAKTRGSQGSERSPVLDALVEIANDIGSEPATVALAWIAGRGILPILGPRDVAQLAAGLASAGLRLPGHHADRLSRLSRPVLGQPYELLSQVRAHDGMDNLRSNAIALAD